MIRSPSRALALASLAALLCGALAGGPAAAQRLLGVTVPRSAAAGQPVEIAVAFDISAGLNCGMRVSFGDGRSEDFKVNQQKDARYLLQHRYERPGQYTVLLEPKSALPVLRCLGEPQRATLTITGAR